MIHEGPPCVTIRDCDAAGGSRPFQAGRLSVPTTGWLDDLLPCVEATKGALAPCPPPVDTLIVNGEYKERVIGRAAAQCVGFVTAYDSG
jgi:hypothetical protein